MFLLVGAGVTPGSGGSSREKAMKKYITGIIMTLGVFITLSVLLYPTVSDYINARSQSRIVAHYYDDVANLDESRKQEILDAAHKYNSALLYKADRFKFTDEETAEYKKQLDVGRGVMGILTIDKIGIDLPVYHGTDEGVLQVGAGHLQGTSLPVGGIGTHSVITGHRGLPSSKLLSDLDKMTEGDTFTLYVLDETLTYMVDDIQTVEPNDVKTLYIDPDTDHCTLITCTPYGVNSHRLLVRGHRIENAGGWETVSADVKQLDKIILILIFLIPVFPALIIYLIIRCVKIRKGSINR